MKDLFGLNSKTVVITGGSGGVGGASARVFAGAAGAKVALLSRRGADSVVEEIRSLGGAAMSVRADITNREEMEAAFSEIEERFGAISVLLNVSGVCEYYPTESSPLERAVIDEARWDRINEVNGKGAALAIELASRRMKNGGSIVNVGSTAGRFGADLAVIDYSYSKAGVVGLTLGFAKILAPLGIRVNAVAPGPILGTEMLSAADEDALAALKAQTRLGKLCSIDDIARINLFLASEMSAAMTGETLDANCGQFISY